MSNNTEQKDNYDSSDSLVFSIQDDHLKLMNKQELEDLSENEDSNLDDCIIVEKIEIHLD